MLAIQSPVLMAKLTRWTPPSEGVPSIRIELPDPSDTVIDFREVLRFMYCGTCSITSYTVLGILHISNYYEVRARACVLKPREELRCLTGGSNRRVVSCVGKGSENSRSGLMRVLFLAILTGQIIQRTHEGSSPHRDKPGKTAPCQSYGSSTYSSKQVKVLLRELQGPHRIPTSEAEGLKDTLYFREMRFNENECELSIWIYTAYARAYGVMFKNVIEELFMDPEMTHAEPFW